MRKIIKRIFIFSSISIIFFVFYKLLKWYFFSLTLSEDNLFYDLKSESFLPENWLLYVGIFFIFISIVGIISLLFSFPQEKKAKKEKRLIRKFEDLYSN